MKYRTSLSFSLKSGATILFFTLCTLVVACGSNANNSQTGPGNPGINVTIDLNGSQSSPTPAIPDYLCGTWLTNTSPGLNPDQPDQPISIFAKFVHIVDGNPIGVDAATATATIVWPDQSTNTATAKTSPDGLAVFSITLKSDAVNKLVLVQVTFTKVGTPPCQVPQPAYFTPVLVSPTAPPPPPETPPPFGTPVPFRTPPPFGTPPFGVNTTPGQ